MDTSMDLSGYRCLQEDNDVLLKNANELEDEALELVREARIKLGAAVLYRTQYSMNMNVFIGDTDGYITEEDRQQYNLFNCN